MKRQRPKGKAGVLAGPSQRQLRTGELVRHALAEIMRESEINDPALAGVSITVTEVRMGPDLRHATCFVEPLGGEHASEAVEALNRHNKFLRGRLGRLVDLKFVPDLKFRHDESFTAAEAMNRMFDRLDVRRDLGSPEEGYTAPRQKAEIDEKGRPYPRPAPGPLPERGEDD